MNGNEILRLDHDSLSTALQFYNAPVLSSEANFELAGYISIDTNIKTRPG